MFSYSHQSDGGWLGEYDTASNCLIAGRATYGDDNTIFVASWRHAHYSELFIGATELLSYMRERAEGKNIGTDAFDNLTPDQIGELDNYLADRIGEWEADLPAEAQSSGVWIEAIRGYRQGEEIRPGHFRL